MQKLGLRTWKDTRSRVCTFATRVAHQLLTSDSRNEPGEHAFPGVRGWGANEGFLLSRIHPGKNVCTSAALASPSLALARPCGINTASRLSYCLLRGGGLLNAGAKVIPAWRPSAWPESPRLGPSECLSGVKRRHNSRLVCCLSVNEAQTAADSRGNVVFICLPSYVKVYMIEFLNKCV